MNKKEIDKDYKLKGDNNIIAPDSNNKGTIKINYQIELDKIIDKIDENGDAPSLLLHSCCGPCSSYVLEYLSKYFKITVLFYNPNIFPSEEYYYRVDEQIKIIEWTDAKNKIEMLIGDYDVEKFYDMSEGMEDMREGGARCMSCYEMRLKKAAEIAKKYEFDYFTTTLSISPHKNSQVLNKIAEKISKEVGVSNLPSDFKKKSGYKRSCEISKEAGLYRQDYCGCEFSKREMEERNRKKMTTEMENSSVNKTNEVEQIQIAKKELRKKVIERANNLDENYIKEADKKIIDKLLKSEEYLSSNSIFCYVGKYPEINTSLFIEQALKDGKKISVPYCVDKSIMTAQLIKGFEDLRIGTYGILEPDPNTTETLSVSEIDLIIVPCSTADKNGNRLGFGRGYYDRFLSQCKGEKILLIRKQQLVESVPMDVYDVKIEKMITE